MNTSKPVLFLSDIERHKKEQEDIKRQLKELQEQYHATKERLNARLARNSTWLEAVRVVLEAQGHDALSEQIEPAVQQPEPEPKKKSLTDAIMDLQGWETGRTSGEVIAALRKVPDVSHISNLGKQVYTNLNRLVERHKLTKSGNKYFLAPEKIEPSDDRSDGSKSGPVNGSDPSLDFNPARHVH